jgi:hypothetical protein
MIDAMPVSPGWRCCPDFHCSNTGRHWGSTSVSAMLGLARIIRNGMSAPSRVKPIAAHT